jgi:Icc-related predicted phosphoesterase
VRVVCISDTHNQHQNLVLPAGDILIHCGDFSDLGTLQEFQDFSDWLESLPFKNKIICPGNHDVIGLKITMKSLEKKNKKLFGNAILASSNLITVENLSLFLIPYSNKPASQQKKGANVTYPNVKNIDLLITHAPPLGILDVGLSAKHSGESELLTFVQQNHPRVHLFGHIHQCYGSLQQEGTLFINCASFKSSTVLNPPIVLDIHPLQKDLPVYVYK